MNWRRAVTRGIAEAASLVRFATAPAPNCRILMYHSVGGEIPDDRLNIFSITPSLFSGHMAMLATAPGVRVVSLDSQCLEPIGNHISISFDDGYKDNLYVAAPIIAEHGFPFTVFVSSGLSQPESRQFLSPGELRELAALPNVTIGAHGLTHVALTKCSNDELRNELHSSKHLLEDMIGRAVTMLAYPYGAVNRRVRDAAEEAGYAMGVCSYSGTNHTGQDPLLLSRTSILGTDTVRVFKQKIRGDWDWYRWVQKNPALD